MPQVKPKPFVYGDPITQREFVQVRSRIIPDWRKRCRHVPAAQFIRAVHNSVPHRLAFEIDRIHGLAFDAGELE